MNDSHEKVDKETIGMLRNAHMKQTQLTMLADQKAHMLTGIILISLSIIVSNIAINEMNSVLTKVSFFLFCVVEIIAVLLALSVIMPRLGPKVNTGTDIESYNPLFFMHFLSFDKSTFYQQMMRNVEKPETVYKLLLDDFYDMGSALKRKYVTLRYAYLCAAFGLIPVALILLTAMI
jgi:hypothetical protein